MMKSLREALAASEHDRWARWEKYRARALNLDNLQMWNRKAETPYNELTEAEKESDRREADITLGVLKTYGIIQ